MTGFGIASYSSAAVLYALLCILLCTIWRGRLQGGLLLLTLVISLVWSMMTVISGVSEWISLKQLLAIEVLRNVAWAGFLWGLLRYARQGSYSPGLRALIGGYLLLCVGTLIAEINSPFAAALNAFLAADFRIVSHVIQAIVGLILVEQLFRNTRRDMRWSIKFLCFGVGGLFIYDFVLFAEALLFGRIDTAMWDARGVINAIMVPLVAVSAARNAQWSVNLFISRSMVFHSTALLATGVYLLVMATAGFYLRDFGGSWGRFGQVIFIAGALIVLLVLMFSGRIRAQIKVFCNRHFFAYKYDYRKEWLDLNRALVNSGSAEAVREGVIKGLSDVVESSGGALWVKCDDSYCLVHELNTHVTDMDKISADDSLIAFMNERRWVIEAPEYFKKPAHYEGLKLENWCQAIDGLWLVVPLVEQDLLYGFIVLVKPRVMREINWEDHDLLKTVGQQLAIYLSLVDASDALAHARQFEAYNRLSAFVVHDLKNLVAQLKLVVSNAEKHRRNPEFVDDVIDTLANSVDKMNRLLAQLRNGNGHQVLQKRVYLKGVLESVVLQQKNMQPLPELIIRDDKISIVVNQDKLIAVLGHLVQNAQDATENDGWVKIHLYKTDNQAIIELEDSGRGMDVNFIRQRLFKPFDTTKGNAGMGIGVFEARQFVEQQGGVIEVESRLHHGTKFTLKLPLDSKITASAE